MSEPTADDGGGWNRASSWVAATFVVLVLVTALVWLLGAPVIAPAVGWTVAAGIYSTWAWLAVNGMDADATASHATRDDPTRRAAHTLLIFASVASFGVIGVLLAQSGRVRGAEALFLGAAALMTVTASWFLIHILFMLRYAATYYLSGGTGIDFNQTEPPRYRDFAYLAFTLGMTYQVSDTALTSHVMRREVLHHALLSFLWGVVVLATTISLITNLAT
ncbi:MULTISPECIES: DUF1345 domain-containing protein [unclassified Microbacterium]|uniref:DUF1345 domain-containing protein n=1 Tax=unclassified Microbacterium TaxID=2609290 RepID=UPI00214CF557|nr:MULTISPECIES: DUF1345 domain-containing protein [unclassified Microbacterium]MCR2801181.1 DUF1345 domain-containing protein [Microbacterium sp. zg.Y818]MCR2825291.1 DUF1345 domain-containing protein [Microbacterium sp. zg.Y909]WIM21017.1 DUF1345 domain-containing protein [Microbacterium sp. zg-Y818]